MHRAVPCSRLRALFRLSFCFGALCFMASCGAQAAGAKPVVKPLNPQQSARAAYFDGMRDMVEANYSEAIEKFQKVARSPRYVKHGALAKVRIGDALFYSDRLDEAARAYKSFVAQHGSDPNVPYARFRIAECAFKDIPASMFIEPPPHEKDQSSTHRSVRELRGFLDTFPMSKFARKAKEMLDEASRMLMAHDLYVADFYESRDKPRAVAWRIEHIINAYPEVAKTKENIWRMAKSYEAAEDFSDAKRAYALYLATFPDAQRSSEIEKRIDEMQQKLDQELKDAAEQDASTTTTTPAPNGSAAQP